MIEFVTLHQNFANLATATFLNHILTRFGALAKVLTNLKREFFGVFEKLCIKALIDNISTLQDPPKADALVERVVQINKCGLMMNHFEGATGIGTLC